MGKKNAGGISERHERVLKAVKALLNERGYAPSVREIGEAAGMKSPSDVNGCLKKLAEAGYIEREKGKSRSLRLTARGEKADEKARSFASRPAPKPSHPRLGELVRLPLLGRIRAGGPVPLPPADFSYFDPESWIDLSAGLLQTRDPGRLFALEVEGDSMIDALVNDGDLVVLEGGCEVRNGQMAAVLLKDRDETTLKYFFRESGRVRLQPANPAMKPILIDDPSMVEIQGRVVMVVRRMQ